MNWLLTECANEGSGPVHVCVVRRCWEFVRSLTWWCY